MGDFKSEIEEQKKIHLCVDMTNISPPSEKNVPLLKLCQNKKRQTFVGMHRFLILFLQQAADRNFKKGIKNGASQQTFDPSYFVRALERANALTGIFKPHYT